MTPTADGRPTLEHLKELVTRAEEDGFTDSELLLLLTESISEAEKCAGVARQLASQKVKTRARQSGELGRLGASHSKSLEYTLLYLVYIKLIYNAN